MDLRGLPAAPLMRTSRGRGAGQDEANQYPAIAALIKAEGMREVEGWSVSASAFSDSEKWARTFETIKDDFRDGRFKVIVIRRINRFSRRARLGLQRLWELQALGIHVISVEDPEFGVDNVAEMALTRAVMKLELAELESSIKSRATREGFRDDSPRGRPPTGYQITGDKRSKRIVKSEDAGAVAQFITDVAEGVPAYKAGHMFPRPTRVKIMAHDCYSTGKWEVQAHDGRTLMWDVPILVPRDVHLKARAQMAERKGRNGKANSTAIDRGDYSGAVKCECGKIMYAAYQGQVKRYYYKCSSGHTARTDTLTAAIDESLAKSQAIKPELRWDVLGERDTELLSIKDELARFDIETGDVDRLMQLRARKKELETAPELTQDDLPTVRYDATYGLLWRSWSHAQRIRALESEISVTISRDKTLSIAYPKSVESLRDLRPGLK